MPGHFESTEAYCSVQEAAAQLRCSEQTVRNMIRRGDLQAIRSRRGNRTDIHRVAVSSVDALATTRGSRPRVGLPNLDEQTSQIRASIEGKDAAEAVNLRYTNLRLMEIQEDYAQALAEMARADAHRAAALAALERVATKYRSVVQQFHLPGQPPVEEGRTAST